MKDNSKVISIPRCKRCSNLFIPKKDEQQTHCNICMHALRVKTGMHPEHTRLFDNRVKENLKDIDKSHDLPAGRMIAKQSRAQGLTDPNAKIKFRRIGNMTQISIPKHIIDGKPDRRSAIQKRLGAKIVV